MSQHLENETAQCGPRPAECGMDIDFAGVHLSERDLVTLLHSVRPANIT